MSARAATASSGARRARSDERSTPSHPSERRAGRTERARPDEHRERHERPARDHDEDRRVASPRRERAEQVIAALGRLDAEYRAILIMRDVEGFDYQQMAVVLELPLGTLKSRLFRARLALRDELKTYMRSK